ncbi:hypothetical protein WR25_21410 [Diploscapter pachys]|uniref:N-terminal methionine N(alpha)-acetyltransferase NatE n=1 Tax=Diploscapter pachys TaxID=2018661 RepID=A0A2A2JCK0_9BILA|nr:hypothetical protein WR25_21410 [Diploscapter pachys]
MHAFLLRFIHSAVFSAIFRISNSYRGMFALESVHRICELVDDGRRDGAGHGQAVLTHIQDRAILTNKNDKSPARLSILCVPADVLEPCVRIGEYGHGSVVGDIGVHSMEGCSYGLEDLRPVVEANVRQLQIFNMALFPVPYDAKFYSKCINNELTRLIFDKSGRKLLGAVCAITEFKEYRVVAYIRAIGVDPLERERGIGTLLLQYIEKRAHQLSLGSVQLHVQVSNEDAISFYLKRGYRVVKEVKDYYRRIIPPHAYLMEKDIEK